MSTSSLSSISETTGTHSNGRATRAPRVFIFEDLPVELLVHVLTYLRAYDLSAVQQVCRFFAAPALVHSVIKHTAEHVYPPELTTGFQLPGREYTFESLRNMEWMVVARVLSRPEPSSGGFYVSKSWCKTALKWLQLQQDEEQQQQQQVTKNKPSKKSKKKHQRMRNRRLSDASPPWPNVNSDLVCCHDNLQHCQSNRSARSRRRMIDKKAWKVLKKLYPESSSLETEIGECLECKIETEQERRKQVQEEEQEKEERRKPLACPLVRAIYTRGSRGVPHGSLTAKNGSCPLMPGMYHFLPRSWLHQWRRYLKTGEGDPPIAPDAAVLLCDAHSFPLIPPHLESYLYGESPHLLTDSSAASLTPSTVASPVAAAAAALPVGMSNNGIIDQETRAALIAAGVSPQELDAQQSLMRSPPPPRQMHQPFHQAADAALTPSRKELLDLENLVVVEILTDDEYLALEKWWPTTMGSNFGLRFLVEEGGQIHWSTQPCRGCDATGKHGNTKLSLRNRGRNKSTKFVVKR